MRENVLDYVDAFTSGRWLEDANVCKDYLDLPEAMLERLRNSLLDAAYTSPLDADDSAHLFSLMHKYAHPDPLGVLAALAQRTAAKRGLPPLNALLQDTKHHIEQDLIGLLSGRTGLAYEALTQGPFRFYIAQYLSFKAYLDPVPGTSWDMRSYIKFLQENRAAYADFESYVFPSTTYFFRSHLLEDLAQAFKLLESGSRDGLEVLVIGTSTGAEAYTIAMYTEAEGIDARILGIDQNPVAIEHARRRRYPLELLDDVPFAYRCFLDGDCVRAQAANRVSFLTMDVTKANRAPLLAGRSGFDMLCFRNVLKYMTPGSARRARYQIARVMNPGAVLVVDDAVSFGLEPAAPNLPAFRLLTERLITLDHIT